LVLSTEESDGKKGGEKPEKEWVSGKREEDKAPGWFSLENYQRGKPHQGIETP